MIACSLGSILRRWQSKPCPAAATKSDLEKATETIMARLSTLKDTLDAITASVDKVKTEVEALKASLEQVEIPADAQVALDRLAAAVKAVDEVNPDAPLPEV